MHLTFESPEDATAASYTEREEERIAQLRRDSFVGTGPEVAARTRELVTHLGVDEVAIVTWAHSEQARRDSYASLAKAFELSF